MQRIRLIVTASVLLLPVKSFTPRHINQHQKQHHAPTDTTSSLESTSSASSASSASSPVSNQPISYLPASMGDADVAFRKGNDFEQQGLFRTAHAAYHEAATLYQCYLDQDVQSYEFSHVTELESNDKGEESCRKYLAETCMRLAFLSADSLGDPRAAIRLYKEAARIDTEPNVFAYDGIGNSIEASFPGNLKDAVQAYNKALEIEDNDLTRFYLGVALERLGEPSEEIFDRVRRSDAICASLVDSWGYIRWHTRRVPNDQLNLHRGTRSLLQIGVEAAMDLIVKDNGLACEFGVAHGRSLRMIQELLPLESQLHGFDTFHGLPLPWGDAPAGTYSTGGTIPNMEGQVYFYKGFFRDTIPEFLESRSKSDYEPLAFANIDCAMYGSTLEILEEIHSRVVPGTVFVFADYIGHPTWRQDEFRAWRECCKRFGWQYEYLGFSFATKQVAVRVTSA